MARTRKQIEESIIDSIESINPDADTEKGPVYDTFVRPQAQVVRNAEFLNDDLARRYSLDYVLTQNRQAIDLYGFNHGMTRSGGRPSSGQATIFTYSRVPPGSSATFRRGSIVSTSDPTIAFQTLEDAVFVGDNMDVYFNASERRYEIDVEIESLGNGVDFELPPNRIRIIRSQTPGIDGVINRTRTRAPEAQESNEEFGRRVRTKFNGTAQGSLSGLRSIVRNSDPARIDDVSIVFSTDPELFRRHTRRAAFDVYLLGETLTERVDNFVGDGLTTEFVLTRPPVREITQVKVGNVISSSWDFVPDVVPGSRESYVANDVVRFTSAPSAGADIEVKYEYDAQVRVTQEYIQTAGRDLFEADTLVRRALQTRVGIDLEATILSSFDSTQAVGDMLAISLEFANPTRFTSILYPDDLKREVASRVGGISQLSVTRFQKHDVGGLLVDALEFADNEIPVTQDSIINITVTT